MYAKVFALSALVTVCLAAPLEQATTIVQVQFSGTDGDIARGFAVNIDQPFFVSPEILASLQPLQTLSTQGANPGIFCQGINPRGEPKGQVFTDATEANVTGLNIAGVVCHTGAQ